MLWLQGAPRADLTERPFTRRRRLHAARSTVPRLARSCRCKSAPSSLPHTPIAPPHAHTEGPQVEFQPGRIDSLEPDAPQRLPDPAEALSFNIAYFWTNGLTNFDMVNLLSVSRSGNGDRAHCLHGGYACDQVPGSPQFQDEHAMQHDCTPRDQPTRMHALPPDLQAHTTACFSFGCMDTTPTV